MTSTNLLLTLTLAYTVHTDLDAVDCEHASDGRPEHGRQIVEHLLERLRRALVQQQRLSLDHVAVAHDHDLLRRPRRQLRQLVRVAAAPRLPPAAGSGGGGGAR